MRLSELLLIMVLLSGMAGAHTYDPERIYGDRDVIDMDESELEWGDTMEVSASDMNATYTIEVNDFHVEISRIEIGGGAYKCGDCRDYTIESTANLRIYKDYELVLDAPFRANESALRDGSTVSTKASSWDRTGMIWNHEHDFYVTVSKITCDFADDDCFCTDPQKEKATVRCFVRRPAEFETSIKTKCVGGDEDEMSVFRSNSVFKAEIKLKNIEMKAYHVNARFYVEPTEMIDGEYPPDCTIEKIYRDTGDAMTDRTTRLPVNPRIPGLEDSFEGDSDITYTVYFKTPSLPQRTEYAIRVNLTHEDFKEKPYHFTDNSTTIEILPVVEVKKAIGTEDYAVVSEEAAEEYTSDVTYVIYEDFEPYVFFTVINWGNYNIPSLKLSDIPVSVWHKPATTDINRWRCALPAEMLRIPDMEQDRWEWNFSLEPDERMTCAYPVSLLKPGSYKLGAAVVNWTEDGHNYSVSSYPQSVDVHGPYIEVTKNVDPASVTQNDTAKIVVSVKNTGDRPTSITILDQVPMAAALINAPVARGMIVDEVNGTFSLNRVMQSGAEETFEYTVDPNRTVILPPAVVRFVDLTRYEGISVSEMPLLSVEGTEPIGDAADKVQSESEQASGSGIASAETVETIETPVRQEPGFAGILAILACLAAALIGRDRR